ncbi:unnamed protein product [Chrysodeixis includens]|uniref:Uncharacterized protein n=1 Tax=Chrysodeixis includens TaxID=689277 RepID=A0A9P0FVZ2_CHRIL|nr:unnamed protein product [Chrysodeixis includens]
MAPRETTKSTVKMQTNLNIKDVPSKGRASPVGAIKKTILVKKTVDKTPLKINNTSTAVRTTRQRTSTVPMAATPKPKREGGRENKSVPVPGSVTKSAKKPSWKRRPKPAHSGVPIPEKMKKIMAKEFLDPQFVL